MRILLVWLINALSLLAVPYVLPSVSVDSFRSQHAPERRVLHHGPRAALAYADSARLADQRAVAAGGALRAAFGQRRQLPIATCARTTSSTPWAASGVSLCGFCSSG